MTGGEEGGRLEEGLRRLQQSQLAAGQSAFDAINGHDRLMQTIRNMMAELEEIFGGMDMVNMEITAAIEDAGLEREQKDNFCRMNDKNAELAEQLLRSLQGLLAEAEAGSETIHRMEDDIAQIQEDVERVCSAARKQ